MLAHNCEWSVVGLLTPQDAKLQTKKIVVQLKQNRNQTVGRLGDEIVKSGFFYSAPSHSHSCKCEKAGKKKTKQH